MGGLPRSAALGHCEKEKAERRGTRSSPGDGPRGRGRGGGGTGWEDGEGPGAHARPRAPAGPPRAAPRRRSVCRGGRAAQRGSSRCGAARRGSAPPRSLQREAVRGEKPVAASGRPEPGRPSGWERPVPLRRCRRPAARCSPVPEGGERTGERRGARSRPGRFALSLPPRNASALCWPRANVSKVNVNKENCKHERRAFHRGRGEGTLSRAVPASVPRLSPARPGPAPRDPALHGRGAAGRRAPGGRRLRSAPDLGALPSPPTAGRGRAGSGPGGAGAGIPPGAARVRRADFIALRGFRAKGPRGTRSARGDGAAGRGTAPGRLRRNEMKAAFRGSWLGLRPPDPCLSSSLRREIKRTNVSPFEGGQRAVSPKRRSVFLCAGSQNRRPKWVPRAAPGPDAADGRGQDRRSCGESSGPGGGRAGSAQSSKCWGKGSGRHRERVQWGRF